MSYEQTTSPNIFSYAPSELTQDAFICWLAEWADPKYQTFDSKLHNASVLFLKSLLAKHDISLNGGSLKPDIKKQHHDIDVVIDLEDHVLLIEDKVFTKQHSNQLQRYKDKLEEEHKDKQVLPIYFQTGSQSNYEVVKEKGYKLFLREDFLSVLEEGMSNNIENEVFKSFYKHLKRIDERFNSFQNKPVGDWDWDGWKGFYTVLKDNLDDGGWDYVANPSGGFMGYWWNFIDLDQCTIYLQLENEKLCFKISVDQEENYSKIRNRWHRKVLEASKSSDLNIRKPARFGHGKQMTIAVLDGDYRQTDADKIIDLEETLNSLKEAVRILEASPNN